MPRLEDELSRLEARIAEAQRSVKQLTASLTKIKAAAQTGATADIEKGLSAIQQRGRDAAEAVAALSGAWSFDTQNYLANGFSEELKEAASEGGIDLIERDGRLSVFPVLLKIEPGSSAVRVGKTLERRIRPRALVKILAAIQKKPQRLQEQAFLNLLYRAYRVLCASAWKPDQARGPLATMEDLHALLTLAPGSDYSLQEFGRDLLLLDRRPELRTRDGARVQFEGATIARERVARINAYDEQGMQHVFIALRFVAGGG